MRLFWVDVETTGLDPMKDHILEVAIAEATVERPYDVGPVRSFVRRISPRALAQVEMDSVVFDMHTRNGLFDACVSEVAVDMRDIENALDEIIPAGEKGMLAGSTVHFDRTFLTHWMGWFDVRLHHRHFDVSAIKMFCESAGMARIPKAEAHRAAADVLESVEHARLCRAWAVGIGIKWSGGLGCTR
jgi:oligoribonuclease